MSHAVNWMLIVNHFLSRLAGTTYKRRSNFESVTKINGMNGKHSLTAAHPSEVNKKMTGINPLS
jgi:hypothetical protein